MQFIPRSYHFLLIDGCRHFLVDVVLRVGWLVVVVHMSGCCEVSCCCDNNSFVGFVVLLFCR
jgi:hypothetical protein